LPDISVVSPYYLRGLYQTRTTLRHQAIELHICELTNGFESCICCPQISNVHPACTSYEKFTAARGHLDLVFKPNQNKTNN